MVARMKQSACVLMAQPYKDTYRFLSVSRKHDHNDWGLPGGKLDPGETIAECAYRECLEETGMKLSIDMGNPFVQVEGGWEVTTYHATDLIGVDNAYPKEDEAGKVGWRSMEDLIRGSFGAYNADMFCHFGYLKKFLIYYTRYSKSLPDVVYAKNAVEASKQFIRNTKGIANIVKCEEVQC